MYSQNVYEHYKPLRNHLRPLYLSESLYVLWAFSRLSQFNRQLPADIENPNRYLTRDDLIFNGHISPWEIELLAKEAIINSHEKVGEKTLRVWNYFSSTINKLKTLEDYISGVYISQDTVLLELNRIAHRQFPWQSLFPQSKLSVRYYLLFSQLDLDLIIQKKIGLTTQQVYLIGILLLGTFTENIAHLYPLSVNIKGITPEHIDLFLNHFCLDLKALRTKLIEEQEFNEKYAYSFNSLRTFPITKMDYRDQPSIVCPIPTLLFWRFTSGLYYEICGEKGFENAFGQTFQNYVGEILKRAIKSFPFFPEDQYHVKKARKDSIDWIVDSDALLFIECKTRRMGYAGKAEIISGDAINNELSKMANIIIQAYTTISDFKNGYYTHLKPKKKKQIFPLIITLEDWYFYGDKLYNQLHIFVENCFKDKGLPLEWLEEMPYSICSLDEFEVMAQVIESVGVKKFVGDKVFDKNKKMFFYGTYTPNNFPDETKKTKDLFEHEWKSMFSSYI